MDRLYTYHHKAKNMLNVDLLPIITFEYNMCYELWLWFMNIYMELIAFGTNIINNIYVDWNEERTIERMNERGGEKSEWKMYEIFILNSRQRERITNIVHGSNSVFFAIPWNIQQSTNKMAMQEILFISLFRSKWCALVCMCVCASAWARAQTWCALKESARVQTTLYLNLWRKR